MAVVRVALLLILLCGVAIAVRAKGPDERELRAAMVYKLMLFVDWPAPASPDAATRMVLCVVSDDPETNRAFARLIGNTVKGRPLAVRQRGPLADLADCDAAYFDRLDAGLLADKLAGLAGRPILTVSSAAGAGAMIDLSLVGNRLVFDVDVSQLRAARLTLAARVVQLARELRP